MDLTQTLQRAAQDRNAEQQLHDWTSQNYAELATALAREIATEDKPFLSRQMASLYLKNTLYGKTTATQTQYHERWKALPPATRTSVKEALLQGLQSPTEGIPHFTAVVAAEVAAVELPYREWPALLPQLTETVTQQYAPPMQQAAFECLGYTMERIAEIEEVSPSSPELPTETVDQMLTTMVQGIQPGQPNHMLRRAALTALYNSLFFVRKNMHVPEERNFILRQALMEATQSPDPDTRALSYKSLDQVAELYYEILPEYMTQIFELTTQAIQTDPEEKVQMAALEFWSTLAAVEQALLDDIALGATSQDCPKYTHSALPSLVPLLLNTLTKQDEDADEEEDINLHSTGALCLQTIAQTVEEDILGHVMPFVQENSAHSDWRMKDASLVAFSCVLDGPDTQSVASYIVPSIPVLLQTFQDPNEVVRQSAIHCLSTICRLHAAAIQTNQVHGILEALLVKLDEPPRVATYACAAIYNIARSVQQSDKKDENGVVKTNLLSQPMMSLLQKLFQVVDRPDADSHNLRRTSLTAAAELINGSANDVQSLLVQVLPNVVERVEGALKLNALSSDEVSTKNDLLRLWCALYTSLLRRLPAEAVAPYADRCMTSLLQILQLPHVDCHDEVLMAISAMADLVEHDFAKYLDHTMPFVVNAISNFEATHVCRMAVGTLVDICINVGGEVQRFADQFMNVLLKCLQETAPHRSIKPVVISALGDIAQALQSAYEPYLQMSQMLLMQAAQTPIPPDNEDLKEFINELRCSVLEAYSGIFQGMADANKLDLIMSWLQSVFQFLQWLSQPNSNRDEAVVVKAVNLIGDIARLMGSNEQVRTALQTQPFVVQLLTECVDVDAATWAHSLVSQKQSTVA